MAVLTDLPVEVIALICREFCAHCMLEPEEDAFQLGVSVACFKHPEEEYSLSQRRNLLNLSLVCKYVSTPAQQFIHHCYGFTEDTLSNLHKFCRTISQRPDLAASVQKIAFGPPHEMHWSDWEEVRWVEQVIEKLRPLLSFESIPITDPLQRNRFVQKALPILTLIQLPALKYLAVVGNGTWFLFNDIQLKPSGVHEKLLSSLKCLRLIKPYFFHHFPMTESHLLSMFEGPFDRSVLDFSQLEHLVLLSLRNFTIPDNLSLPKVCELSIKDIVLSRDSLETFVKATGDLRFFTYAEVWDVTDQSIPGVHAGDGPPATSHDIFSILETKKDTLLNAVVVPFYPYSAPDITIAPLSRLSALRVLQIGIRAFCDPVPFIQRNTNLDYDSLFPHLPPGLERLRLGVGAGGLQRIMPAVKKFCSSETTLSPAATSLRLLVIDVTPQESAYEVAHGVDPRTVSQQEIDLLGKDFGEKCAEWKENGKRMFQIRIIHHT